MKRFILLISLLAWSFSALNAQDLNAFFSDADAFLQKYVSGGLVDYRTVKQHRNELDELIGEMAAVDLQGKTAAEIEAFWINAYNLTMIKSIVGHYLVKSPLDIPDVFTSESHTVARQRISLEIIEKQKLLAVYKDPRLHFVLVCGAKGCPPLADFAFRPENLNAQMDQRTRKALNSSSFIRLDYGSKKAEISQIFEWYQADFLSQSMDIRSYINQYRNNPIPADFTITYYTYDWSLNEKKN